MHFLLFVCGDVEKQLYPYLELDLSQEDAKLDDRSDFSMDTTRVDAIKEKNKDAGTTDDELLEDYMSRGWGYTTNDKGDFGYYENPKAKYDWFQVGGRWRGFFQHVSMPTFSDDIKLGEASLVADDIQHEKKACDVIRKCDIDRYEMEKIIRNYRKQHWKEMKKGGKQAQGLIGMDKLTMNEYVDKGILESLTPYAIIMPDGSWIEGNYSKEVKTDWNKEFAVHFNSLPYNTLISAVDCHI